MAFGPGARLGPYDIVVPIGEGGMGVVYRARDTRLDRDVAIKVLPSEFAADQDRRRRFEREAKAVAALSHPNVLAVYDTGLHGDELFIVTELLEGESLAERLKRGPLPVRKALEFAVQIARGLAAAHDRQIVHRDLKPDNVFVMRDGTIKILDFGLARHAPTRSGESQTVRAMTDPGVVMGTAGYMAPEQIRGEAVDARTDLFAFGALLYEMLSGRRAFSGDTAAETMTAILREEPSDLSAHRPDVPPALDRLVRHCLEKAPSERFESARDVAFAIDTLSAAETTTTSALSPAQTTAARRVRPMTLGAMAAVAVLGAVVWWLVAGTAGRPTVRTALGDAVQLTADDGLEIHPAISPDGRLLAYSAGGEQGMRIFIRPVAGGRTITLSDEANGPEFVPRWSPDGTRILYLTHAGAFVASALGGASRPVASGAVFSAAWAPDGRRVAVTRLSGLSVVDTEGGTAERELGGGSALHSCAWQPTDVWIACASGNSLGILPGRNFGNIADSAIVLVPVAGGEAIDLVEATSSNLSPAWSPDGTRLFFVSDRHGVPDVYVVEVGADGELDGEAERVTTGLGVQSISLSGDGRQVSYATYAARANLWALPIPARGPVGTAAAEPLTQGNQVVESVSVSRDGGWLLYDSDLHQNTELFRMPIDGGSPERLTNHPALDFAPSLSPDGRELAFHSIRNGTRDVFVQALDGSSRVAVTGPPRHDRYPRWSPSGHALVFWGGLDLTSRAVYLVAREAGGLWSEPRMLARSWSSGQWTEDSGEIVFVTLDRGIDAVDVETASTRPLFTRTSPDDPEPASVAVAGDTVYFKSHAGEVASFWAVPLVGGQAEFLVDFSDAPHPSIRGDFAVGAGRFFFTLEDRQADIWLAEIVR